VDMDLNAMDADSPVLWIRVDPEMNILRQVIFEQPDYQWQYQLKYERDITAQFEAILALAKYLTPATRLVLTDTIENDQCFYSVRCKAAACLTKVANSMVSTWAGPPAMLSIFRKKFGSYSCQHIVRQNNFQNFQHYFLQKAVPLAMAGLRNIHNICPNDVLKFLLDLFKYNDNSKNKFSDNYYRSSLVNALGESITPVVSILGIGQSITAESLSSNTKLILEEITRYLNLEKLLPCYKFTVTVSCLRAIRKLQKFGHIPSTSTLFVKYASYGHYIDVREAALECLVDFLRVDGKTDDMRFLFDLIENDPYPYIKYYILKLLIKMPPFARKETSHLDTEELVDKVWRLMNSGTSHDARLRCSLVDFYFMLYGRNRPGCIPIPELAMVVNLKERKTMMNPSMLPDPSEEETQMSDKEDINDISNEKQDSGKAEQENGEVEEDKLPDVELENVKQEIVDISDTAESQTKKRALSPEIIDGVVSEPANKRIKTDTSSNETVIKVEDPITPDVTEVKIKSDVTDVPKQEELNNDAINEIDSYLEMSTNEPVQTKEIEFLKIDKITSDESVAKEQTLCTSTAVKIEEKSHQSS
ncbi:TAF2 (predicted), partial [Pycnogonum litorale]